jgi:hypothetical protein
MFIAVFVVKSALEASKTYHRAEAAYTQGKVDEARLHYERTIKFHTPLSPITSRAIERLWQLGATAEEQGNTPLALAAYRSLRSSLYAIQSVYSPYHHPWIPNSESKIAALMAHTVTTAQPNTAPRAQDSAVFLHQLQRPTGPRLGWAIVTEIGFLGWIGATVGFIWRASTPTGGWAWRPSLLWGGGGVVCFTLWIIGMLFA